MSSRSQNPTDDSRVPDLVVCTRFGVRVRNLEWLQHRLELLASITAPSLLAQRDQHFHWIVLIGDSLPEELRDGLENVVRPFGSRAIVYQREQHSPENLIRLAEARLLSKHDRYLFTGRLDDDDAWCTTMVGAARARVASWIASEDQSPGLSFTFQDGLEWIMYEMLDVESLLDRQERLVHTPAIRRYSLPFISTSVFVCSKRSAKGIATLGAHSRVAEHLSAKKGFSTDIIGSELPMWLCCRHKQACSGIRKAQGPEVQLTLKDLVDEFGLDETKVQHYLDQSDKYQYALLKDPLRKKGDVIREWLQVSRQLEDPTVGVAEMSALERRRDELTTEMARLEEEVLGDPEAVIADVQISE